MNEMYSMYKIKLWITNQVLINSKQLVIIPFIITLIFGFGLRFIFFDDNIMNMLPESIESRQVWEEIIDEFKYSDFIFVAFGKSNQNIMTKDNLSILWDISKKIENIKQVDEVISIATISRMDSNDGFLEINDLMPQADLTKEEEVSIINYLDKNIDISYQVKSKNSDYLNIIIRPKNEKNFSQLVSDIRDVTRPYEDEGKFEFYFGGQPYIAGKVPTLIQNDTRKLMLIGLVIMSIILLINLRSFQAVGMILLLIIMSMVSMLGALGWIYYFTGSARFYFSFINSSMPIVLLTIANSDGVHILSRFFREARKNKSIDKAINKTLGQLLLPILLTSFTTSAAFFTMTTSPIPSMTGYGIALGSGILWAWILSSTFLPALIKIKKWNFSSSALSKSSFLEKVIHIFSLNIIRYPKKLLFGGLLIVLISSFGIHKINVEVNMINLFKPGHIIRESTLFLDNKMAGSMNLMMKIEGDVKNPHILKDMEKIQDYLITLPAVNTSVSIVNIIKKMHQTIMDNNLNYNIIPDSKQKINNLFTMYSMSGDPSELESLVNYEYDTGLITTMMNTVSTKDVVNLYSDIQGFINNNISNLNIEVSGLMIFLVDFVSLVVKSSIFSILVSVIIILFITWIFFRSLKYGLLSVVPLISAIIMNFGLMGWFGIDLTHFTALLTSVIIGVGVDFAIHYISEFNNYAKEGKDINIISREVVDSVGYPILLDVFSNMGFAALIFSSLIPLIQMGGLMIFAMISTSLGTLTILAALMEINKYNLCKREEVL